MIARALKQPDDYFAEFFKDPLLTLSLIQYSLEQSNPEDGVQGCGSHTDYGCLTLLLTNEVPGLEIKRNDKWIAVPPIYPGGFIVNIGDMLERWSNGRFKSTVHRVTTGKSGKLRLSAPFFFEPNYDAVVQSLPGTGDSKFEPITCGEYLRMKFEQAFDRKEEKPKP